MAKILALLILMTIAWTTNLSYAQAEGCLPIRFLDGQEMRVIGSIDVGGVPLRAEPTLSDPVIAIIPLDTILHSGLMKECEEGRNWYSVSYQGSENDEGIWGWVIDGDGYNYWLEPTPICTLPSQQSEIQINRFGTKFFGLEVSRYDEETNTLHFSFLESGYPNYQKRFFELDLASGFVILKDSPYDDLITRELTDKLGITKYVFETNTEWDTVYISPDKTKILYRVPNPPITPCAHTCQTEALWIANIDGSNPIKLIDFYAVITNVQWNADATIQLSMSPIEVFSADFVVRVCEDGSCDGTADDWILGENNFPYEHISGMPMTSPNGEWVAVTVENEQLIDEGIFSTGAILNIKDGRYIELPYNGQVATSILWESDNMILYPVAGLSDLGWDGRDYGLPEDFYEYDALWYIKLDFENLTYDIYTKLSNLSIGEEKYRRLYADETFHITRIPTGVTVHNSSRGLGIYCFMIGQG